MNCRENAQMVAGDQPAPQAELKPSLTQAGGISARLDELTAVGSGGEVRAAAN